MADRDFQTGDEVIVLLYNSQDKVYYGKPTIAKIIEDVTYKPKRDYVVMGETGLTISVWDKEIILKTNDIKTLTEIKEWLDKK